MNKKYRQLILRTGNELLKTVCVVLSISSVCQAQADKAPYPSSKYIVNIDFRFETVKTVARGSDIWPVTWTSGDKLYTAWGDGKGFAGNEKVSWGIASLNGTSHQWKGLDIFYGPAGSGNGKISGLLAVGDTVYALENVQNRPYPYADTKLIRSVDQGITWSDVSVVSGFRGFKPVSFINDGPGYAGAKDHYLYMVGFKIDESVHHVYLVRVKRDRVEDPSAYVYFSGMNREQEPIWQTDSSKIAPVFTGADVNDGSYFYFPVITYNKGLSRYILTDCHGPAGTLGIFESTKPWGPWKTVYYADHWGGLTKGAYLGFEFPNKWASEDGQQLKMVFSVYDSNKSEWNDACNVMSVILFTKNHSL